ncbi:MAG: polysaccharide deacetylase family protein [Crocinitomicaceae bacterium]
MRIYSYPKWLKVLYPGSIWGFFRPKQKVLYLTFDDGPSLESTNWILNQLEQYNAKATFFCLGNQVKQLPELYSKLIQKGNKIGNHSMSHPRGLRTKTKAFVYDVLEAQKLINSKLFRAPYGSLKFSQHKALKKLGFTTVFWSYVTYDFAIDINIPLIISKMKKKVKSGDIIVFHDSAKALPQLKQILPVALKYYSEKGFSFDVLDENNF